VLSSVFFAQNNFHCCYFHAKGSCSKNKFDMVMSSFESINQTFFYKNKNIVSETLKNLCIVSNFYVILRMFYETT